MILLDAWGFPEMDGTFEEKIARLKLWQRCLYHTFKGLNFTGLDLLRVFPKRYGAGFESKNKNGPVSIPRKLNFTMVRFVVKTYDQCNHREFEPTRILIVREKQGRYTSSSRSKMIDKLYLRGKNGQNSWLSRQ